MTDDRRLDELLDDAARTYRVPPKPPLDAMWARIEAEAFNPRRVHRVTAGWRMVGLAAAASLALGVGLGRVSVRTANTTGAVAAGGPGTTVAAQASTQGYQRTTEEFFGRTALLLAALPRDGSGNPTPTHLPEQATQLLTTTRLLLDSPVGAEPRMKELLQDLELVLAQVARLQPRHENVELTMITQTLEERDLVPRIRSAVTDRSALEY